MKQHDTTILLRGAGTQKIMQSLNMMFFETSITLEGILQYPSVAWGRSQILSKISQFTPPVDQQILAQMTSNNKFTTP